VIHVRSEGEAAPQSAVSSTSGARSASTISGGKALRDLRARPAQADAGPQTSARPGAVRPMPRKSPLSPSGHARAGVKTPPLKARIHLPALRVS
jgi:hypothetical protein